MKNKVIAALLGITITSLAVTCILAPNATKQIAYDIVEKATGINLNPDIPDLYAPAPYSNYNITPSTPEENFTPEAESFSTLYGSYNN